MIERALADASDRCLHGAPSNLADSIRYSLLAPGKRIRPRLALASARLAGLDERFAAAAAVSIEMVHCFTLIHDDLPCMDDDDFRRGRPSNHKKFGEATALLAGDALMAMAVEALAEASSAPGFSRALKRLALAMGPRGVIGGQAAEALLGPSSKLADLRAMHAGKTGALFEAALLIPADLAGVVETSERGRALAAFAAQLGLAFQCADDLEDRESGPTCVLYYLSAEEAARGAREGLVDSLAALEQAWSGAGELAAIAGEVLGKLA